MEPIFLSNKNIYNYQVVSNENETVFHIPRGLYILMEPLLLQSNCTFMGDGPETILKSSPNFAGSRLISNGEFQKGNSNIRISSLKVIFDIPELFGALPGGLRFENVTNLSLEDIIVEAKSKYYCIDLSASTRNVSISNCSIVNMGSGGGIQVRNRLDSLNYNSKDIRIQGNFVRSIVDEPIAVFGWLGQVSNVVIEENTIVAHGASFGISAYGIDQDKHTGRLFNVIIRNNVINGSRIGAIAAKGGVSNVLIKNNLIDNTDNDGIFIDNGGPNLPLVQNIDVIGNRVSNTGRHGLYVKGGVIRIDDNLIQSCSGTGIFISGKNGGSIEVINNTIASSGKNIIISGPSREKISGNRLSQADGILRISN